MSSSSKLTSFCSLSSHSPLPCTEQSNYLLWSHCNRTDVQANVAGLIIAGSADFKTELNQSDMFDPASRSSCALFLFDLSWISLFLIGIADSAASRLQGVEGG